MDRRKIIYKYKFKITRKQISELLKMIYESASNAEEKAKIRWSALNAAKYILEMFKEGRDVFDGGCKETFLNDEKIEEEGRTSTSNNSMINNKAQENFNMKNKIINIEKH
uniref:Uncharacterized protein n=1 Tax=Meloidogyne hapla TaxID=6305 RepID=A0A1I8BSG3_MELHA